jgi:hypothetical protein
MSSLIIGQNGRSAARCDRTISGIQAKIQKEWQHAINLQSIVSQIPKINQDIEGIMKVLGKACSKDFLYTEQICM